MEKGLVVIVELLSSEKPKILEGQSKIESLSIDQPKQIDHVHRFTSTRKMGANIRQNILPNIFDHETSHTRMLSVVDYEKGILNIIVLDPKEQNKVTNVSMLMQFTH